VGAALESLHQVIDEFRNLVAEKLEGDDRATSSKISPVATSNLFWTEQEMCLCCRVKDWHQMSSS